MCRLSRPKLFAKGCEICIVEGFYFLQFIFEVVFQLEAITLFYKHVSFCYVNVGNKMPLTVLQIHQNSTTAPLQRSFHPESFEQESSTLRMKLHYGIALGVPYDRIKKKVPLIKVSYKWYIIMLKSPP